MKLFDYDATSRDSVFSYAKKLEGMTFNEIYDEYLKEMHQPTTNYEYKITANLSESKVAEPDVPYESAWNAKAKGQLGNIIEKYYFGYEPNGNQEADFKQIGVELKATPIDVTKKGEYKAGERLSITNISYEKPVEDDFYKSHVWEKIKCILLVQYLRDKSVDRMDYMIKFVNLFSPPEADLKIIINDYKQINEKIKQGKAHELSEGDTLYLGACTKGATAASSLRPQYYGDHALAKKRNYCFKNSYMNYVLQNYVLKNNVPCESIIKQDYSGTFQELILSKINKYIGMSDEQLCQLFNRPHNNNKAQWNDLAFRMLGIKSNQAAEFEKANIVVKTIRIEKNGKNKESMSLPPFKFKELVKEEWETSTLFQYLDETQFLFVVYTKVDDAYILSKALLWHMPYKDLNEVVRDEWLKCQSIIKDGIVFTKEFKSNHEISITNNLPGMKDTEIIHIRPHAQEAAYKLKDGYEKGDITKNGDELPNGEWMTKQSFWLNSDYIWNQIQ